jgi:hypothetical protein
MPHQKSPDRQSCLDLIGDDAALMFADGHDDAFFGNRRRGNRHSWNGCCAILIESGHNMPMAIGGNGHKG